MAEVNEDQVEQDENVEPKVRKSRSGFWFGIIILLLIISVAGIGYFLLDQLREQQEGLGGEIDKEDMQISELTKQITGYQTQIAAIQAQLSSFNEEISGKENHFNSKLNDFSELHSDKLDTTTDQLKTSIERIQRQLGKTRGDWLLSDAEYLMSAANRRLHLMSDVKTSLEALKAADNRLRESGDAAAFKVREQLAKEISALKKVTVPDIVGLYAKVQILEDDISQLTLFLPYPGKDITKPTPETETTDSTEDAGLLDSALDNIGDLVTIRYTEQPIKSVLSEEEAVFLREQLKVKLEMVKIALVQRNDTLYNATLADARKWTQEHFLVNPKSKAFIAQLDDLDSIQLRAQLPDVSQSLKMLRDITKLRIETDKALFEQNQTTLKLPKPTEQTKPAAPAAEAAETKEQAQPATEPSPQPTKQ